MGRIYANATLNLAATASVDNTEGLFHYRDSRVIKPFPVSINWRFWHLAYNKINDRKIHYEGIYYLQLGSIYEDVFTALLNKRG